MHNYGHLRKILDIFVDSSQTLMDFYGQLLFSHGYLTNTSGLQGKLSFSHRYLTHAHGRSRMIFDSFTDVSRRLPDFHVQFLIRSCTPHGRSRTWRTIFYFLMDTARTLTDLYVSVFDFFTDSSLRLAKIRVRYSIFLRTPYERSRTFPDNL